MHLRHASTPYFFNSNIKISCLDLAKTLKISENVSFISVGGLQSNFSKISCVTDKNYETHELPGMKLDWRWVNSLFSMK